MWRFLLVLQILHFQLFHDTVDSRSVEVDKKLLLLVHSNLEIFYLDTRHRLLVGRLVDCMMEVPHPHNHN